MKLLHNKTTSGYFSLILLLALVLSLPACKKKQSPPAQEETQKSLVKSNAKSQAQEEITGDKIPLRILYVGLPDTERQKDFVSFLSKNFIEVKTAGLYTFMEEQTKDSDVIILDKDGIQWGNEGGKPLRDLRVSAQYSRPTISLGIPGAFWTDRMRLKTGYM
jgi:hypothetical protein